MAVTDIPEDPRRDERGHVLMLVENLPVPFDRRVWQEALALRAAGNAVTVVCPRTRRAPKRHEVIDGVTIRRFWLPVEGAGFAGIALEFVLALLGMTWLTLRTVLRHRVDVVHVANPPDLLFLPALAARWLRGAAIIYDHHDANPELALQKGFEPDGVVHRTLHRLEAWTFRASDVVISTNLSYRDIALGRGGKAEDDVFVVRSAPRSGLFDRGELRPEFRRGRDCLVLYLGVMGAQEGLDVLVEAVAALPADVRSATQFVLVGDGPERRAIAAEIERRGLRDDIVMTGRISDDDLADHLRTADVCVNPDPPGPLNDISTMNKVVEYLATGNPVVQFDTVEGRYSAGDAAEYAAPGPIGLASALEKLLRDPDRCHEMGRLAQERFRTELAWERQVPALLAAHARARSIRHQGGRARA